MPSTTPCLYLPVSTSTINAVLQSNGQLSDLPVSLSPSQVASLLLLANLPALPESRTAAIEKLLARTIELCTQASKADSLSWLSTLWPQLDLSSIRISVDRLASFNIQLLNTEQENEGHYLTEDGRWDYTFCERHYASETAHRQTLSIDRSAILLSSEQNRLYREFEAQSDDHMHIQGYAGTGKTSLVQSLLAMFRESKARILLLAEFRQQLDAVVVSSAQHQQVHKLTYGALSHLVLSQALQQPINRRLLHQSRNRLTLPDTAIVEHLSIRGDETISALSLVKAVRSTVFNFCQSSDAVILAKHIPRRYSQRFSSTHKQVVVHHAFALWQAILAPPTDAFAPAVRGYHTIKWAALNNWCIPGTFTHVLLDECHHLPEAVNQILSRSPQARLTLGDDYQNLKGRSSAMPTIVRQREMVHSIRSGQPIESLINPIINTHPSAIKAPFKGNELRSLAIDYYHRSAIPDSPALILVSDNWGLFEWAQRLAKAGANTALLSSLESLSRFVQDCIELKTTGTTPRHGELFRFTSWDSLVAANHEHPGFQRISQLLERGYSYAHWQATCQHLSNAQPATFSLGLVENVRNREFDNVMLSADLCSNHSGQSRAVFNSSLYVALTRARRQLLVPELLRDWIEGLT